MADVVAPSTLRERNEDGDPEAAELVEDVRPRFPPVTPELRPPGVAPKHAVFYRRWNYRSLGLERPRPWPTSAKTSICGVGGIEALALNAVGCGGSLWEAASLAVVQVKEEVPEPVAAATADLVAACAAAQRQRTDAMAMQAAAEAPVPSLGAGRAARAARAHRAKAQRLCREAAASSEQANTEARERVMMATEDLLSASAAEMFRSSVLQLLRDEELLNKYAHSIQRAFRCHTARRILGQRRQDRTEEETQRLQRQWQDLRRPRQVRKVGDLAGEKMNARMRGGLCLRVGEEDEDEITPANINEGVVSFDECLDEIAANLAKEKEDRADEVEGRRLSAGTMTEWTALRKQAQESAAENNPECNDIQAPANAADELMKNMAELRGGRGRKNAQALKPLQLEQVHRYVSIGVLSEEQSKDEELKLRLEEMHYQWQRHRSENPSPVAPSTAHASPEPSPRAPETPTRQSVAPPPPQKSPKAAEKSAAETKVAEKAASAAAKEAAKQSPRETHLQTHPQAFKDTFHEQAEAMIRTTLMSDRREAASDIGRLVHDTYLADCRQLQVKPNSKALARFRLGLKEAAEGDQVYDFGEAHLGDRGAACVLHAVARDPLCVEVSLRACSLRGASASCVACYIELSPRLRRIDLSENHFSFDTGETIFEALQRRSRQHSIDGPEMFSASGAAEVHCERRASKNFCERKSSKSFHETSAPKSFCDRKSSKSLYETSASKSFCDRKSSKSFYETAASKNFCDRKASKSFYETAAAKHRPGEPSRPCELSVDLGTTPLAWGRGGLTVGPPCGVLWAGDKASRHLAPSGYEKLRGQLDGTKRVKYVSMVKTQAPPHSDATTADGAGLPALRQQLVALRDGADVPVLQHAMTQVNGGLPSVGAR